jgi:hypothetical protein
MIRKRAAFALILLAVASACTFLRCGRVSTEKGLEFSVRHEMIPMHDGICLHTAVITPKGQGGPFPILLVRSPYGLDDDSHLLKLLNSSYDDLARDGYIFAFQDIRGRYLSQGHFVMLRLPCAFREPKCIDEGTRTRTIQSLGSSKTYRTTTGGWACLEFPTMAGSPQWP